ncbi:MAG: Ig-like domain-containing protein [Candidatus Pacebacteria bacterium]|nr:Ig-like domain-containing protein [Candidatus Paceibacterota bacterium]
MRNKNFGYNSLFAFIIVALILLIGQVAFTEITNFPQLSSSILISPNPIIQGGTSGTISGSFSNFWRYGVASTDSYDPYVSVHISRPGETTYHIATGNITTSGTWEVDVPVLDIGEWRVSKISIRNGSNGPVLYNFCLQSDLPTTECTSQWGAFQTTSLTFSVAAATTQTPTITNLNVPSTVERGETFAVSGSISNSSIVQSLTVSAVPVNGENSFGGVSATLTTGGEWNTSLIAPSSAGLGEYKVHIFGETATGQAIVFCSYNDTACSAGASSNAIVSYSTVAMPTFLIIDSSENSIACTSITYASNWSECVNGQQTKAIISRIPENCSLASSQPEFLTETCTSTGQSNPQFTTISITPASGTTIYSGSEIRANLSGSNLSGIASAHIVFTSIVATATNSSFSIDVSPSSQTNNLAGTVTVPSSAPIGQWKAALYYYSKNGSIVYNGSDQPSTTFYIGTGTTSCVPSYSAWSECSASGTRTRTIISTSPANCTVANPVLAESCDSNTTLPRFTSLTIDPNPVLKTGIIKATITGENITGVSKVKILCESVNATISKSFEINVPVVSGQTSWFSVMSVPTIAISGQWKAKIASYSTITTTGTAGNFVNYTGEEVSKIFTIASEYELTCQQDQWSCGAWGECANNVQKRVCTKTLDCLNADTPSPDTEQSCTAAPCVFQYSDWSVCSPENTQTRTITAKTPEGCDSGTAEPLIRDCSAQTAQPYCKYDYSDWSDCIDGKQMRTIVRSPDSACSAAPAQELLEKQCVSETAAAAATTQPTETQSETAAAMQNNLDPRCTSAGQVKAADCQLYLLKLTIVSECRANNANDLAGCRDYLLNKYGQPLKCQGQTIDVCNSLIDNVILADLRYAITPEVKENLIESAGHTAVINTQTQTIAVDLGGTLPPAEIKVENLPLAPSAESIKVALLKIYVPAEASSPQAGLSPVAIVFDDNGNGVPDDIEARLKETNNVPVSPIDKAIVGGQPLEQPKFKEDIIVSTTLKIGTIENIASAEDGAANQVRFQGTAAPNEVLTIYIYSQMPIVLTVKADVNGNWVYDLDKSLIDGTHEVYVAVNDDKGKIVEASLPTPFFIQEAQATTIDAYAGIQDAADVPDKTNNMLLLYIIGGAGCVLLLIGGFLFLRERNA